MTNRFKEALEWIVTNGKFSEEQTEQLTMSMQIIEEALTLAQEVEELRVKAKWQSIIKAPYGHECLLLAETGRVEVGQPRNFCDGSLKACYTHFMPLPDAPEQF